VDAWRRKAVEVGGRRHRVGTHVLKQQPVAHRQVGQAAVLGDAVQAIAGGPPDAARVHGLVWLWLLLGKGVAAVVGQHNCSK